jgi:hypothetical protein
LSLLSQFHTTKYIYISYGRTLQGAFNWRFRNAEKVIESTTKNRKKICIKTQHKPKKNELIHKCADKIDGLILVLETLRRNEAVQHTASTILFFPHLFLLSAFRAGYHRTHFASPPKVRFFCLGKKNLYPKNSLFFSHHFNSNLPFCLFFFFFSFRDCRARFYRSSERQKRFSWFLSFFAKLRT